MNGLPSNLVVCCKTIYFNSLNKFYHLIIYAFHKNNFLIRAFVQRKMQRNNTLSIFSYVLVNP